MLDFHYYNNYDKQDYEILYDIKNANINLYKE